jgi:hypothetical protein
MVLRPEGARGFSQGFNPGCLATIMLSLWDKISRPFGPQERQDVVLEDVTQ